MPKHEHTFQDRILDAIRDMEDAVLSQEREHLRSGIRIGGHYGLSEDEVRALYNEGMKFSDLLEAIEAATVIRIGRHYGLSKDEVLALCKEGMKFRDLLNAIVAARKNDWPPDRLRAEADELAPEKPKPSTAESKLAILTQDEKDSVVLWLASLTEQETLLAFSKHLGLRRLRAIASEGKRTGKRRSNDDSDILTRLAQHLSYRQLRAIAAEWRRTGGRRGATGG